MKKFVTTILAFVYLSTSMGATIHLHYCMGKLFSWSLTDRGDRSCEACGMPRGNADGRCKTMKSGCCKDTHTIVKLDKDQKAAESAYKFFTLSPDIVMSNFTNLPDRFVSSLIVGYPKTNAAPDPGKVPIFVLNRNFRI